MFGFRPGNYADPPPKGLQNLPPAPGYTVRTFPNAQSVSDWCEAWGVAPGANDYNHTTMAGCVVPGLKAVGVPAESVLGRGAYNALISHEDLHTYNVVHDGNDKGWYLNGPVPQGINPQIAAALAQLPKTQQYAQAAQANNTAAKFPNALGSLPIPTSSPNALKP